jgi:AraC family transcriptional regulator, transcriptional activator of pobA
MLNTQPRRIKTISEYHHLMGLPKPEHPLISLINFESIKHMPGGESISLVLIFIPSR